MVGLLVFCGFLMAAALLNEKHETLSLLVICAGIVMAMVVTGVASAGLR